MKEIDQFIRRKVQEGAEKEDIVTQVLENFPEHAHTSMKHILNMVDEQIVIHQVSLQTRSVGIQKMAIGALLLVTGLGVTAFTRYSGYSTYILAYGALITGVYFMYNGYKTYTSNPQKQLRKFSNFKK
jgi:hypothetical protein